jgi:hypothetical protein
MQVEPNPNREMWVREERQIGEPNKSNFNITGANLDKVVQRATATHCTTIEKGYMVMKNVWIWRVKVSGISEK